jgi:hypothetical protein
LVAVVLGELVVERIANQAKPSTRQRLAADRLHDGRFSGLDLLHRGSENEALLNREALHGAKSPYASRSRDECASSSGDGWLPGGALANAIPPATGLRTASKACKDGGGMPATLVATLARHLKRDASMKIVSLSLLLVFGGCATAPPPIVSAAQKQAFSDVVRKAEAEGAATDPPEAAQLLREAKSEFDYAQRMPRTPARARSMLKKAQADAEAALLMARRRHEDQMAAGIDAGHEATIGAQAVPVAPAAVNTAPLTTRGLTTPGTMPPMSMPGAETASETVATRPSP